LVTFKPGGFMPKHKQDSVHSFIAQALTSDNTDLDNYKDESFKIKVRKVAIDSIVELLQQIEDDQSSAKATNNDFSLEQAINTSHNTTGLNILDYCLVAGFNDMAVQVMHLGARTENIASLHKNISKSFDNPAEPPDILKQIDAIIKNCLEIKKDYDHLVAKTNELMPRVLSLGKSIASYSTPSLLLMGIAYVVFHPVVHGAGAAAMVSAALLPGVVTGVTCGKTNAKSQPQFGSESSHETAVIKNLLHIAKSTQSELKEKVKAPEIKPRENPKKLKLSERAQAPLLHHLESIKAKQAKIKAAHHAGAELRHSMSQL
jgi:hypothetical protein